MPFGLDFQLGYGIKNIIKKANHCYLMEYSSMGKKPNFDYSSAFKNVYILDSPFPSMIQFFCPISFPLNILRINGQILTKFCLHIDIDKF